MAGVPSEFAIADVFFPPLLLVAFLALALTLLTAGLLNRYRLSKYFFFPPLVFGAIAVVYSAVIAYTGIISIFYVH